MSTSRLSMSWAAGLIALTLLASAARAQDQAAVTPVEPTAPAVAAPEANADGFVPPKIGLFAVTARKINRLLQTGDATAAEALLVSKEPQLSLKPYYRFLLVRTAKAVNQSVAPQLVEARAALDAVNSRKKFTDNSIAEVAAALGLASAALKAYRSHPLLQREEFAMPEADEINARLATAGAHLKRNAKAFFLAHDHAMSNFFDVYPLQLSDDESRALVAVNDRWITVAMASEQPGSVLMQYLPLAVPAQADRARKALAAQIIKRNRWPATLGVSHEFHLSLELNQELGLPAEDVAMVTIGNAAPDIPGVLKNQTLDSVDTLAAALKELQQDGVRYVLVRDLGRALAYEQALESGKPVTGRRVIGMRKVANPAYAQAQAAVRQAESDLSAAQQRAEAAAANAQVANALFSQLGGGDNTQGWMALAGKTAANVNSGSANSGVTYAQSRLNQAQMTLANTPTQIDEPVEENYPMDTRRLERTMIQELAVYYLDLKRPRLQAADRRETLRQDLTLPVRFDARDRHQDRIRGENETKMGELRMALPVDHPPAALFELLERPLALVASSPVRGLSSLAALAGAVGGDSAAWEKWKAQRMAANAAQVELGALYSVVDASKPAAVAEGGPVANDADSILWHETRQMGTVEAYEWYLEKFPAGLRAGLARAEIRRLKAGQ